MEIKDQKFELNINKQEYDWCIGYGSKCCFFKIEAKGSEETVTLLLDSTRNSWLYEKSYSSYTGIYLQDDKNNKLSDSSDFNYNTGYKSIIYDKDTIEVEASTKAVFVEVLRDFEHIEKDSNDTKYKWIGLGENYVSINGEPYVKFANSSESVGNNKSPALYLKEGLNVIELCIDAGETLQDNEKGIYSLSHKIDTCVYLIEWNGKEEAEENRPKPSSNTAIRYIDATRLGDDYANILYSKYPVGEAPQFTIGLPKKTPVSSTKNEEFKQILLGVIPEDPLASWKIVEPALDENRDGIQVGIYHAVTVEDTTEEIVIEVTAEDGTSTRHTIPLIRGESNSKLKNLTVKGIKLLDYDTKTPVTAWNPDKDYYAFELDEGSPAIELIPETDDQNATYKINNGEQINGDADIIDIQVTAEDSVTTTEYYLFRMNTDRTIEAFTIPQSTKDRAKEMLDKGWNKRDEKQKKKETGESRVWSLYKQVATDPDFDLNGICMQDPVERKWNQATDYASAILELIILGENPYNYKDHNYVADLEKCGGGPFANNVWYLLAAKAAGIDEASITSMTNSVKGQLFNSGYDLDINGWNLAVIAPDLTPSEIMYVVKYLKRAQNESGNIAGMFRHSMHPSNTMTQGCTLSGLSAANVNIEKLLSLATTDDGRIVNALSVIQDKYQREDGQFWYSYGYLGDRPEMESFNKDIIIALGDIANGESFYQRYNLDADRAQELLLKAKSLSTADAGDAAKTALASAISALESKLGDATGSGIAYGMGQEYYALQDAMYEVDPSLRKGYWICDETQWDKLNGINDLTETLATEGADSYAKYVAEISQAKADYDALGKDNAEDKSRLQGYVADAALLESAYAQVQEIMTAVQPVIDAINALPGAPSLAIEGQVNAAWASYGALSDQQKKAVTNIAKLQNLRSGIQSIRSVESQIAALPSVDRITLNDLQAVTQAQDAFDRLGSLKAEVPNAGTLTGLLARLQDLQTADDVTKKIAEIGDLTEDNWKEKEQAVQEADAMFKRLTEDQRGLVTGADLLEAAKRFIEDQKLAAADKDVAEVILRVRKLRDGEGDAAGPLTLTEKNDGKPTPEVWTEEWISQVKATRSLIHALTPEKVSQITNLADQEQAEECIRAVEVETTRAMIEALPDPAAVAAYGEEPTEGKAPLEDAQIAAIREAKEAFDALERKDLLNDPALEAKLSELCEKAQTYPYWDEARLQPYVDELTEAYSQCKAQPLDRAALAKAQELTAKHDGLTDGEKAVLQGMSGGEGEGAASVPDMLAFLSEEIARVQKDIEDAAQADQYIEDALSAEVNEANAEAIRADVASIEESLSRMSEAAKSYMNGLEKLRTAKSALEAFDKAAFTGGRPAMREAKASGSAITVKWEAYNGAAGYRLFRRTASGQWGRLADVRGTSYKDESVRTGVTYYYAVKAISGRWPGEVSGQEAVGAKAATLGRPSLKKAVSAGYGSVKLAWGKAAGANGYEVYRAAGKNGEYKKVGETTALSFTDKGLKTGTAYRYKVRGYNTVSQTKAYGGYSAAKSAKPVPSQAKIARAAGARRAVKLTWKKVDGASGYTVYRAASKNGQYKAIKTLKGAKRLTYTDAKRKKDKTYYYKVRAYRTVSGKKVYGPYSAAKGAKAK